MYTTGRNVMKRSELSANEVQKLFHREKDRLSNTTMTKREEEEKRKSKRKSMIR
jgi:hypothetical protein